MSDSAWQKKISLKGVHSNETAGQAKQQAQLSEKSGDWKPRHSHFWDGIGRDTGGRRKRTRKIHGGTQLGNSSSSDS
jgi:hypothetical protein